MKNTSIIDNQIFVYFCWNFGLISKKKCNEFKGTCSLCSMFKNIVYQWCDNFCILFISLKDSGLIFNQFHFINIRYILLSLLDNSLLAYCQDQYMSVHLNSGENMPAQAPQWTEFLSCQVRLPNRWFLQHSQIQRFCKTKISFKKFLKMKYGLFAVADWIFIFYQLIKIFSSLFWCFWLTWAEASSDLFWLKFVIRCCSRELFTFSSSSPDLQGQFLKN